jgi:acyl-coenzyme A thioesterase PaaI-like protein
MSSDKALALQAALARIPYARFLGVRAELAGDEMTAILPFAEHLLGNPVLPALHGGVIGAFMEMTAVLQLTIGQSPGGQGVALAPQPRPIDVTVEYLRSGRPTTTFARATLKRVGRRVANVQVEAWQDARASPIAFLRGHFMVSQTDELDA